MASGVGGRRRAGSAGLGARCWSTRTLVPEQSRTTGVGVAGGVEALSPSSTRVPSGTAARASGLGRVVGAAPRRAGTAAPGPRSRPVLRARAWSTRGGRCWPRPRRRRPRGQGQHRLVPGRSARSVASQAGPHAAASLLRRSGVEQSASCRRSRVSLGRGDAADRPVRRAWASAGPAGCGAGCRCGEAAERRRAPRGRPARSAAGTARGQPSRARARLAARPRARSPSARVAEAAVAASETPARMRERPARCRPVRRDARAGRRGGTCGPARRRPRRAPRRWCRARGPRTSRRPARRRPRSVDRDACRCTAPWRPGPARDGVERARHGDPVADGSASRVLWPSRQVAAVGDRVRADEGVHVDRGPGLVADVGDPR